MDIRKHIVQSLAKVKGIILSQISITNSIRNNRIRITASFGVYELNTGNCSLLNLAYKYVDDALYLAKSKGRNRVEVA